MLALRVVLKDAQDSFAILVNRLRNKPRLLLNLKTFCTHSINQKSLPKGGLFSLLVGTAGFTRYARPSGRPKGRSR